MNRFNFGNQATNGMQIMSVAGTTYSGYVNNQRRAHIADASSALNNLSEEDLSRVGAMRADKLMSDVSRYEAKGESPYQHLTDEEAGKYQSVVADDMRRRINEEEDVDVDDIMGDTPFVRLKSPQSEAIKTYIENNFDFARSYVRDGSKFRKMTKEDLISKLTGGEDTDADV